MGKRPYFLAKAPFKNILKAVGAARVSEKAVTTFREKMEELAKKIAGLAREYASHAGRKTVKLADIQLALEVIVGKK